MGSVGHVSDCYLGVCNALARKVSLGSVWVLENEQSRLPWSEAPCRSVSTKQEGDVSTGQQSISIFLLFKKCQTFVILRLMPFCMLYIVVKASLH